MTEIERLGHLGDGLGDGEIVPGALPGEVWSDGHCVTRSAERIMPVCPHFGSCGGCKMQHASDPLLADWKTGIVQDALSSHGIKVTPRGIHVSPPGARRRAAFTGRRTKKTVQLGFLEPAGETLVDVQSCAVLRPEIVRALPLLRGLVRLAASRNSRVRLQVTLTDGGLDVDLRDARSLVDVGHAKVVAATSLETPDGELRLARLSWNGDVVVTHAPPTLRFGVAKVTPPPGAFLQATEDAAARLVALVIEVIGGTPKVLDLFAGCGTFALPLAERAEVWALESDAEMIAALDAGWRQAKGLKPVRAEARDLFRRPVLPSEIGASSIVLDPPRAGAAAQVAEIASSNAPVVAYVSCNPASFARDAATLVAAGYRLDWVEVVDQFRWSPHVELVAKFER